MGLLNINPNEIPDPKPVKDGTEAELRIVDIDGLDEDGNPKVDKNGFNYCMPRFEIVGEPLAPQFTTFLPIVTEGMDDVKKYKTELRGKKFSLCFGLTGDEDPQEMVGATGWAILGVEESDEYGDRNTIKKFIAA
jgi:hypothetical protein